MQIFVIYVILGLIQSSVEREKIFPFCLRVRFIFLLDFCNIRLFVGLHFVC